MLGPLKSYCMTDRSSQTPHCPNWFDVEHPPFFFFYSTSDVETRGFIGADVLLTAVG